MQPSEAAGFLIFKKISEGDNYYGKKSRCINQEP